MDELKLLPPPEKKVAAKVLVQEGFSLREVEEILGVPHASVARYAKKETPDDLIQFEAELSSLFQIKEHQVAAKALRRIDKKIDNAFVKDALEVYKLMRNKGGVSGQVNVQVNNFIPILGGKTNVPSDNSNK